MNPVEIEQALSDFDEARTSPELLKRFEKVKTNRLESPKKATVAWAEHPYRFVEVRSPPYKTAIIVPRVSSEGRPYIPAGQLPPNSIVTEAFALYDSPLWNMSIIASQLHLVWIKTICGHSILCYYFSKSRLTLIAPLLKSV